MKYAMNQEEFPDSVFPPIYPCDFLDGDGKLVDKACVFADTETGEIIYHQYLPNGNPVLDDDDEIQRFKHKAKPPLTIVPYPYDQSEPTPNVVI